MKWINFLHIYQPPTQTKEIVDKVTAESYVLILGLLENYPSFRLTMNISGSLLELWEQYGHIDVIKRYGDFIKSGRIELVGTAIYHPILPLISENEARRQINLQMEIRKKYFGDECRPAGFYLPEMAYSPEAGRLIRDMGFKWIILDEIHAITPIDPKKKYSIKGADLGVIFRNSRFSRSFPPESLSTWSDRPDVLITAHDGELYGHWHRDDKGFYKKTLDNPDIETLTISDYINSVTESSEIEVRSASWESTAEELKEGDNYDLWKGPRNPIHADLWSLANLVQKTLDQHPNDPAIEIAHKHFDKGLASCAWWWASERRLGPFSPLTWNPTEIEKGATELLAAVTSLKQTDHDTKKSARDLFDTLHEKIWTKHPTMHT